MRKKSNYKDLKTKRQWRATIGLDENQFYKLAIEFNKKHTELSGKTMQENHSNTTTECAFENTEELLFFALFCLKSGLGQDALGFVFGLDGSGVHRNRKFALRVLQATLYKLGVMPKRSFEGEKEFKEYLKEHPRLILDGTEQAVQRPGDKDDQKDFYSGKKNATL